MFMLTNSTALAHTFITIPRYKIMVSNDKEPGCDNSDDFFAVSASFALKYNDELPTIDGVFADHNSGMALNPGAAVQIHGTGITNADVAYVGIYLEASVTNFVGCDAKQQTIYEKKSVRRNLTEI